MPGNLFTYQNGEECSWNVVVIRLRVRTRLIVIERNFCLEIVVLIVSYRIAENRKFKTNIRGCSIYRDCLGTSVFLPICSISQNTRISCLKGFEAEGCDNVIPNLKHTCRH